MKTDTHPAYFPKAIITCACGAVLYAGATKEKINVEICSNRHPFFTGNEKILDIAGRVEKFKTRQSKAKAPTVKKIRTRKTEA